MREIGAFEAKTHLVPADWPDREAAVQAAKSLRAIRTRIRGATVSEILTMRDEGRR